MFAATPVHIAIDDATRLAYADVLPDEKASTATCFRRRAVAFYRHHGISVEWLLTDNGSPYGSAVHAIACRALGIRHCRSRPYRPQTNGKPNASSAPYSAAGSTAAPFTTRSAERIAALDGWLYDYNHHRRHSALGRQTPIIRLNNLLAYYS